MAMTFEELIAEAVSLPFDMRAQMADVLLRSLNSADAEVEEAWAVEAERRLQEVRSGKVKTIPGDEVEARIRKRFGG
jgi:putative addiction module component (TIGR02574 family)